MSSYLRYLSVTIALIVAAVMSKSPGAQGNPEPLGFKFNSGQGVQPIFEGWAYNQDGSIAMYFGYINRNYVESPAIAVGPQNRFEPGAQDRGHSP